MFPALLADTVTSDIDRGIHYALLWGLEGMELRTVGGRGDRVPFVNEEKLKRRLAENELPAVAAAPGMFEGPVSDRQIWMNEIVTLDETMRFCRRIDCPIVVISAFSESETADAGAVDALRRAGAVASRYGRTLAVLNEPEMAHATGMALGALLDAVDEPSVGAAWSPAAALQAGEDPAEGLDALGTRVLLVRCRDGVRSGETWRHAPLGEGEVDWPAQMARLRKQGFRGALSLEVVVEPLAKQGIRDAAALVRLIWAAGT